MGNCQITVVLSYESYQLPYKGEGKLGTVDFINALNRSLIPGDRFDFPMIWVP